MKALIGPTAQAYAELQQAYDHFNGALFGGELPPCLITFQREKRTYGYFSSRRFVHRHDKSETDEIAINPAYFAVVPLLEVLQTVSHEMVHLWQYHFGTPGRRGYHNREWAEKMESIGLMPSDTGKPGGKKTGEKMADYAIDGGAFLAAVQELTTRDFRISWLDRFPPSYARAGLVAIDAGDEAEGEDAGELGELAGLIEPQGPQNRSNRLKFRSPSCGAQAWGKPTLRVLCGGDDCAAVPLDPVE